MPQDIQHDQQTVRMSKNMKVSCNTVRKIKTPAQYKDFS